MQVIYENSAEQALHDGAIDALADEMKIDVSEVRAVYEREYVRLRRAARVRDFLPVLVARHTRDVLRQRETT